MAIGGTVSNSENEFKRSSGGQKRAGVMQISDGYNAGTHLPFYSHWAAYNPKV